MGLRTYRRKRDFKKTPEPAGGPTPPSGAERLYVIQKHAASRLHYDLRLEDGGVLKSWAVPKGPSLDPAAKRLAVQVEDHPIEYGAFEGTIPEGEYGGGSVLLWDRGRWEPLGDASEGLRTGRLKFRLHGQKLRGGWNLVRLKDGDGDKPNWLLMKERDDEAFPERQRKIVEERPESVASGRRIDEIANGNDPVWHSNREQPGAATDAVLDLAGVPHAKRGMLPSEPAFQLATLVTDAPPGDEWLHEIKLDGFRFQCRIDAGVIQLFTRTGQDWTHRFPTIVESVRRLPVREALLDGEIVALMADGRSSFQLLQQRMSEGSADDVVYYLFDALHLDGYDLTAAPLEARKAVLRALVEREAGRGASCVRYSDHIGGQGSRFYQEVSRLGLEGMMSKLRASPYRPGRGRDWLKVKVLKRQEFVVGGFTDPAGTRTGFGALLLGVYEGPRLVYVGRVGTGFNDRVLASLHRRLKALEQSQSPFEGRIPGPLRHRHWVRPEMVVEVAFTEWTSDGLLRHPSFQGVREDKKPTEVVRERPAAAPASTVAMDTAKTAARPAPARAGAKGVVEIAGIRLTHPERVLYPEQGITKRDLALYYDAVAEWMLPHIVNRPLMVVRCPEGHEKDCFHQKHRHDRMPEAVRFAEITEDNGKRSRHLMITDRQGLIALVQMGVLEIHLWGAPAGRLETPDRMIFDLDPDTELPWARVVSAAQEVNRRLAAFGLKSWVKTTGGKGLHVVVPLTEEPSWEEVKAFSHALADALVRDHPTEYTSKMAKAGRKGKIFVDYLRNSRGATAIAPYSTRSRPGAPVALPVSWSDLPRVKPTACTTATVPDLIAGRTDPWKDLLRFSQSLPAAPPRPRAGRR